MRASATWLVWAALPVSLAGCNMGGGDRRALERASPDPPPSVNDADTVRLEATPIAVNWDDRPGPDGLEVRLHFFHPGGNLPVAVNGTVEFILYQGLVSDENLDKAAPFYRWQFSGEILRAYLNRSAVGWGYVMRLAWGANVPPTSSVTLVAVYRPPSGGEVRDRPVVIAVSAR